MEPMSTCKLFGAIRALIGIKNTIPIIHGPRGCAYHIRYLLSVRSGSRIRICSTELSQEDVVFGAENKLKETIITVDRTYKPDLIPVLTSCSTSIIGEDIQKVARELKDEINADIIAISAGGFESDQSGGYEEVLETLIKSITIPKQTRGKTENPSINLIGVFRGGPDLLELKKTLKRMGIDINCVLTSGSNLEDIKNIPLAHLNYSFCDISGIIPCKILREEFGIPFVYYPFPMGFSNSLNFFKTLIDHFNLDYPLQREYDKLKPSIDYFRQKLDGYKAAIIAGPTRAIALASFLKELGMTPVLISIDLIGEYTLKELKWALGDAKPRVLIQPEVGEIEKFIKKEQPHIILGGLGESYLSYNFKIPVLDVMHGKELTWGFQGALSISQKIFNLIRSPSS
ncbi:MAG TPA: nitrogen fixation protein NifE [Methanobacteriales archaeon]|nr:MAG: Nitrogenase [Methanobacteriaceae archaeon 41_258]MBC7088821.1 nitrogenase component 1 [Methanobacteriaceae archaeon]HIH62045.1 nitrogen fixation protein NifE [Methanobacteriales archaeon]